MSAEIALMKRIEASIRLVRGQEIMLGNELAPIYGTETRVLTQAVRRNLDRFPHDDFMFQLTRKEASLLRSQFVTLGKYQPLAFTEAGALQLSTVLDTPIAVAVSIAIMRAFAARRSRPLEPVREYLEDFRKVGDQIHGDAEQIHYDAIQIHDDAEVLVRYLQRAPGEISAAMNDPAFWRQYEESEPADLTTEDVGYAPPRDVAAAYAYKSPKPAARVANMHVRAPKPLWKEPADPAEVAARMDSLFGT